MVFGVYALVALPARRVVHTYLPCPSSARKEVYGATVGGLGRGPYTAGALRGNIRELRSARSDGSPHMGSGSLLVRKVLVQTPNAFLNSPQFCAVQFSFE